MSRFSRWCNSKSGKRTVSGILALALIITIVGQLLDWWDLAAGVATIISPTNAVEVTKNTKITAKDVLGGLTMDYPQHLTPKASDTVIVSISTPKRLVSADLQSVMRVEISDDTPIRLGQTRKFETTILIQDEVRMVLTSPTLSIESLYPETQTVLLGQSDTPTLWAWSIIAPDTPGLHTINLRVYVPHKGETPVWVGIFQTEVVFAKTTAQKSMVETLAKWGLPGIAILLIVAGCLYAVMRLSRRPSRAEHKSENEKLRQKLQRLDDTDLNAFCLDYFPKVYDKFSSGTRRDEKINLLLDYCWRHDRANNNNAETKRLVMLLDKREIV